MSEPIPTLPDPPTPDLPDPIPAEPAPAVPLPGPAPVQPDTYTLVRFMPDGSTDYPVLREGRWWQPGSEYSLSAEAAGRLATEAGFTALGPGSAPRP